MYLCMYVCLPVDSSVYPLSVCLSMCLFMDQYPSVCQSVCLFICLFIRLSAYPPVRLSFCLSSNSSIHTYPSCVTCCASIIGSSLERPEGATKTSNHLLQVGKSQSSVTAATTTLPIQYTKHLQRGADNRSKDSPLGNMSLPRPTVFI